MWRKGLTEHPNISNFLQAVLNIEKVDEVSQTVLQMLNTTDTQAQVAVCVCSNVSSHFNPLPHDKILDWSKLKQISDDILKCIQNGK